MRAGSWAKAAKPRHQWRPPSRALCASKGRGGRDSSVEGVPSLEYRDIGVSCVERVLGSLRKRRLRPAGKGARQGASVTWPSGSHNGRQSQVRVARLKTRSGQPQGAEGWQKSQLAHAPPSASSLRVGDAVRGYPAPSWKASYRCQHKRLAHGRRQKRGSPRRKFGAWELVGSTGARDNKLVAEIGKRHLPIDGSRAFRRTRHGGG
jgi:hypothetical protein